MATVVPLQRNAVAPAAFVEALNGLAVGLVTLDFTRRALAAAVEADAAAAADIRELLDEAWENGRLDADHYEALARDLGHQLGEDLPTEWSAGAQPAPPADDPAATSPQRALRLVPGAVLRGRFVLQERLDSGGMCEVFRALDRRLEETGAANPLVAIKVVGPRTPRAADALRLLQQEAALARRLDHPNVARVHDFDRDGEHAFVTAEWLDGENLGDLLTRERYRPLALGRARRILEDVGAALAFAHAQGIVHADVKPGNVFITRDGRAKLLDFGVARAAGDGGAAAARTPAYASCEVLEGAAPTPPDDVYSLACVAYRMLAGRRAFGHHDALAAEKAGRAPARIPALSEAQWNALARGLAFRRAARTPDVATFVAGLRGPGTAPGLVAGVAPAATTVAATTATAAASGPQPAPARRRLVAGLALVAVAAVAAVSLALLRPRGDEAPVAGTSPAAIVTAGAAGTADTAAATPGDAWTAATPAETPVATAPPGVAATAAAADRPPSRSRPAPAIDAAPRARDAAAPRERAGRDAARAVPATARKATEPPPPPSAPMAAASTPAASLAAAVAAALPAPGPAAPPAGATADTATDAAATGPKQVPLTELRFRRYVEPKVRSSVRDPEPSGWVEVVFVVGADGKPRDVAVTDSIPAGRYDAAALAAVRKWRFDPPLEAGAPVERRTGVRLRFQPE